jgi:hypothetical protein
MPDIARALFARAAEPKELWIVPKAKHNRCREVAPEQYLERVSAFLRKYAPRRPTEPDPPTPVAIQRRKESSIPAANGALPKQELTGSSVGGPLAAPVAG